MKKASLTLLILSIFFCSVKSAQINTEQKHKATIHHRPSFVNDALAKNQPLYYFGVGSNMLRSKVETRSNDGPIEILHMEPAVVRNHRLAFNMRGFAPLEPAMGALEPCETSSSTPLRAYERPECHGALIKLSPENYERVMRSEGISANVTQPGYEEIVVEAHPYGGGPAVSAVALRARPHVRLGTDAAPSRRYMTILQEGAKQLGLKPCYQTFLDTHPVQQCPKWLKKLAVYNLIFTFTLSMKTKWRGYSKAQSWMLFQIYVPPTAQGFRRKMSHMMTALLLLPGSIAGSNIRLYRKLSGSNDSPFLQRMIALIDDDGQKDSDK